MITIKVKKSKIFNNRIMPTMVYTFYCPSCEYLVTQFDCELTPFQCKVCEKPLQDVRGMMDDPTLRMAWHLSDKQFWEQKEQ